MVKIEWWTRANGDRVLTIEAHGRPVTLEPDDIRELRRVLRHTGRHKPARRDYTPQVILLLARADRPKGAPLSQLLEVVDLGRPTVEALISRCVHAGLLRLAVDKSGIRWVRAYATTPEGRAWKGNPTIHPKNPIDNPDPDPTFDY